jgi:hypothetical protein
MPREPDEPDMKPAAARVGLVGLGRMGAAILPRLICPGKCFGEQAPLIVVIRTRAQATS